MQLRDFDLAAAVTAWLRSLPGVLTDPSSPFWWPTLVAAGVAGVVLAMVAGVSLRQVPREFFPHSRREMLRSQAVTAAARSKSRSCINRVG